MGVKYILGDKCLLKEIPIVSKGLISWFRDFMASHGKLMIVFCCKGLLPTILYLHTRCSRGCVPFVVRKRGGREGEGNPGQLPNVQPHHVTLHTEATFALHSTVPN